MKLKAENTPLYILIVNKKLLCETYFDTLIHQTASLLLKLLIYSHSDAYEWGIHVLKWYAAEIHNNSSPVFCCFQEYVAVRDKL